MYVEFVSISHQGSMATQINHKSFQECSSDSVEFASHMKWTGWIRLHNYWCIEYSLVLCFSADLSEPIQGCNSSINSSVNFAWRSLRFCTVQHAVGVQLLAAAKRKTKRQRRCVCVQQSGGKRPRNEVLLYPQCVFQTESSHLKFSGGGDLFWPEAFSVPFI